MASQVSRLRRWFALGAVLMIATVAGMYFYARWRLRTVVHDVPAKMGLNIQQTAEGFSISKSVEGRTQFTVSASKAVQFKEGGLADLHHVKITIYGKDASRFDRISGDDFQFDPVSGNVTAKGTVLIDLEANPEGSRHSDQSPPDKNREAMHVETDGLTFNRNTGNASTKGFVVFQTRQANGSAVGLDYVAASGTMNLLSTVVIDIRSPRPIHVTADHGVILKQPRQILLTTMHVTREQQELRSKQGTFFLRLDNTVERIVAEGDVQADFHGWSETHSSCDRAELFLTGPHNQVNTAVLSGNVRLASLGTQPADGSAGRVILHFGGQQVLQTIHAEEGVRLSQKRSSSSAGNLVNTPVNTSFSTPVNTAGQSGLPGATALPATTVAKAQPGDGEQRDAEQDVEMTAPAMDFYLKGGRQLERAVTSGPPKIVITQPGSNQKTTVTAAKLTSRFTDKNRISTLHGEPNAKIVGSRIDNQIASGKAVPEGTGKARSASPQNDRVSTSQKLDVVFAPEGGIASITQTVDLAYVDGPQKAWGQRGEYTAADQMLVLIGSPRVVDNGTTTTAQKIRMNRVTGDALAEGNVKSTYSDLKAQPDGGMLASSDPIHVTSRSMTAHKSSGIAVYTGNARLWQNANVVEAPTIEFDRDHRSLVAQGVAQGVAQRVAQGIAQGVAQGDAQGNVAGAAGGTAQPVTTLLVQVDKKGNVTPIKVTSSRLTYADAERKIFLTGGVTAKGADATVTSEQMTVFLLPRSQSQVGTGRGTYGQVDRMIAEKQVVVTQPTRHGNGERLVYTSADDKFVLTGNSPSIFDAERGKTTGDSLTFYRQDDRVLVEGKQTSPAVTRTQVAR
jgi:lipopolysaccharide export system protein LptA